MSVLYDAEGYVDQLIVYSEGLTHRRRYAVEVDERREPGHDLHTVISCTLLHLFFVNETKNKTGMTIFCYIR